MYVLLLLDRGFKESIKVTDTISGRCLELMHKFEKGKHVK